LVAMVWIVFPMSVKNSTAVISSRDMVNGFENSHRKDFWGLIGMGYLNGKELLLERFDQRTRMSLYRRTDKVSDRAHDRLE
jgi:hypothetical protein